MADDLRSCPVDCASSGATCVLTTIRDGKVKRLVGTENDGGVCGSSRRGCDREEDVFVARQSAAYFVGSVSLSRGRRQREGSVILNVERQKCQNSPEA